MPETNSLKSNRLAIIRDCAIRTGLVRERSDTDKPPLRRPNLRPFGTTAPHPPLPDWRHNALRRLYGGR